MLRRSWPWAFRDKEYPGFPLIFGDCYPKDLRDCFVKPQGWMQPGFDNQIVLAQVHLMTPAMTILDELYLNSVGLQRTRISIPLL